MPGNQENSSSNIKWRIKKSRNWKKSGNAKPLEPGNYEINYSEISSALPQRNVTLEQSQHKVIFESSRDLFYNIIINLLNLHGTTSIQSQRIRLNKKLQFYINPNVGYKVKSITGISGTLTNNIFISDPVKNNHIINILFEVDPNYFTIGNFIQGGYFTGYIICNSSRRAVIISPKYFGDIKGPVLKTSNTGTFNTNSTCDGLYNTNHFYLPDHPIIQTLNQINNNYTSGYNDWTIPSADQLELAFRHFKPTNTINMTYLFDLHNNITGYNPNSDPIGSPYSFNDPIMTSFTSFRENQSESFDNNLYWSSTQSGLNGGSSVVQSFQMGTQFNALKTSEGLSYRLIRTIPV